MKKRSKLLHVAERIETVGNFNTDDPINVGMNLYISTIFYKTIN